MRTVTLLLSLLLLPAAAIAGRPLNTEDASTLDDRACQVESWIDRTRGNATDFSFVPACAMLGVEWQAGAVRTREGGRSATTAPFVQGADKETRALLHLNVGTTRARDERRNLTLWGVAVEKPVTQRLTLVAEAFGENAAKPFLRAGGRYTVFEGFDVDLTGVTRAGGEANERYWSVGFHWEKSALLP